MPRRLFARRLRSPRPRAGSISCASPRRSPWWWRCLRQERLCDAQAIAERALAIRQKLLPPNSPLVAQSSDWLGATAWARHDFAKAETFYKAALAIFDSESQRNEERVAVISANLAGVYMEVRYAEAEPLLKRVIEVREKASPPDPLLLALALRNLGNLYNKESRKDEAEPVVRRAFDISLKALGPDNPAMWDSYLALGLMCQEAARYAESEQLLEKAVALRERMAGGDDLALAGALVHLGTSYRLHLDYARAEPPYARALAIRERRVPPDDALDQQQYQRAYAMMTEANRNLLPLAQFIEQNQEFHERSGPLMQRNILKVSWTKDPAAAPFPGVYAAIDIATRFGTVDRHCDYVVLYQRPAGGEFEVMRQESNFIDNATAEAIERQQSRAVLDRSWAKLAANCPNYGSTVSPPSVP